MAIYGRNIEKEGFPSGTDYGTIFRWSELDKGEYVMAFCIKEGEGIAPKFLWVIESKGGEVVSVEERKPFHDPIFGIDEFEWHDWLNDVALGVADSHAKETKLEE